MASKYKSGKVIALVLTALIIGFAPLIHALCVGQPVSALSTHVMADGSSMTMPNLGSKAEEPATTEVVTGIQTYLMSNNTLGAIGDSSLIGLIALTLAPACFVLVGLLLSRRLRVWSVKILQVIQSRWQPPPIFHRPTMVDLTSLGISRT